MNKEDIEKKLKQLRRKIRTYATLTSETFDPEVQSWANGYREGGDLVIEEVKKILGL